MPTPQKEQIVKEMSESFRRATSVFLVDFTGLDVNSTNELRKNLREAELEYKVVKNTLAKMSFNNAGIESLNDFLVGVNGYVISYDDPTKPGKVITKNKDFKDRIKFKAVLFEGKVFGPEQVKDLVDLPSRENLLATFVGLIQSPMVKLAGTLNSVGGNLVNVLRALAEQKK
jgi:large subunit ribosomal protein L10